MFHKHPDTSVLQLLAPSALRLMLTSLNSNLRRPQGSDFWALPWLLWFESKLLGCVVSLDGSHISSPTFCLSKFNLSHLSWSCGFLQLCFTAGRFLLCLALLCNCCLDVGVHIYSVYQEFEERWNDKSIPGWQEPTHKAGGICKLASMRFFSIRSRAAKSMKIYGTLMLQDKKRLI